MSDQVKEQPTVANGVQPPQSYTIVRIKRKRTEEPLDALGDLAFILDHLIHFRLLSLVVVDRPRRKKSKGTLNVFQFAETVEPGAWDDERQRQELEVSPDPLNPGVA